jgi:hypothetical protein
MLSGELEVYPREIAAQTAAQMYPREPLVAVHYHWTCFQAQLLRLPAISASQANPSRHRSHRLKARKGTEPLLPPVAELVVVALPEIWPIGVLAMQGVVALLEIWPIGVLET